jgi:PAS domain S-box-containing protein
MLLGLGSVAVYVVAFFPLYALISRSAIALSLLPIALIAVLFGPWAGFAAGLVATPLNMALIALVEQSATEPFPGPAFWTSHVALAAVGFALGYLGRLRAQLATELGQRQQIEKALQESEAKYRNIAELARDGIAIVQDGVLKYCNQQTAAMVGRNVDELLGTRFTAFLAPSQREHLSARYQRRLEGQNEPQRYETTAVHRQGHHITVEVNASVAEFEGRPATLAIVRDMSARERADQALRKSERRYRALFERTNDAVFLLDLEGNHIQVNQRAADLLAYTPEEMVGMSFRKVIAPYEYPDAQEKLDMLLAGEIPPLYERVFRRKDGTEIPVEVNVALVYDGNGNPSHIQSIIRDISERKRVEMDLREGQERLRTLIEHIPIEFWAKDASGRYIMQNPTNRRIHGDSVGLTMDEINASKETKATWRAQDERVFAGETVRADYTLCIRGEDRIFEQVVAPVRVEGKVVAILGVTFDVTEQRRAQDALQRAKETAEAANWAKSIFLANMSHELRTPLNAILGFSELMVHNQDLPADVQENLSIIRRSGEHLLDLINDVLNLSKIEAGRMTVDQVNFDLHQLLADIEDMFLLRAEDKGLQLAVDLAPDLPCYIRADMGKLRQVLINLLGNAIKFTEQGSAALQVSARDRDHSVDDAHPTAHSLLHFSVSDTGPGIAPEELDTVFDAFVQTELGRRTQEGTGLGLAISQQFVRLMGGEITARSQVGHGSRFEFEIPVETVDGSRLPQYRPSQRVIGLAPDQPRYRVLVVDDKQNNRQLLTKSLQPLGFDVREAENGQQAVDIWSEWQPHLIWMDIRMPMMDGYEATRQIRTLAQQRSATQGECQAPIIIALSASSFRDERDAILAAGCDDLLLTPYRAADILDLLHRYLDAQFVYDGDVEPVSQTTGVDTSLAGMPDDWLDSLYQATVEADLAQILGLIEQIRATSPSLTDYLTGLANDFAHEEIMRLVERARASDDR